MQHKLVYFLFLLFHLPLLSQNLGLNMVSSLHQAAINPAYKSDYKWQIGAGSFMADLGTSGIKFNDLFAKNSEGNYVFSNIDVNKKLQDRNRISGAGELSTLSIMYRSGILGISAGHALKVNGDINYGRDIVNLTINGNVPYIGQTLDLSTQIDFQSYNELFLGASLHLGILNLGAKAKFVNGVQHLSTNKGNLSFTTDEEIYQLHLDTDIDIVSAGVLDYKTINDVTFDFEPKSFNNFLKNNRGMLYDFGASFTLNEDVEIFASIIDLGNINWDFQTYRYLSNKNLTYVGIDLADYLTQDQGDISLTDTLYSLLDLDRVDEDFTTKVGADFYLGGKMKLNEKWFASAIYNRKYVGDLTSNLLSFQALYQLNQAIHLGLSYNLRDKKFTNIGFMSDIKIGPAYGFLNVDNVLAVVGYKSVNTANVRVGLSFQLMEKN